LAKPRKRAHSRIKRFGHNRAHDHDMAAYGRHNAIAAMFAGSAWLAIDEAGQLPIADFGRLTRSRPSIRRHATLIRRQPCRSSTERSAFARSTTNFAARTKAELW
jgi:hypothetical protein